MTSEIKELTNNLINIEKEINKVNEYIYKLRRQKEIFENKLIILLKNNNLDDRKITLNNNKLYVCNECNYTPLSYNFLEEQLNILFPENPDKIKKIIKYIKNNRIKKINQKIKIKKFN